MDDLATIKIELNGVVRDHIGAGSSGFGDLPFQLRRKP